MIRDDYDVIGEAHFNLTIAAKLGASEDQTFRLDVCIAGDIEDLEGLAIFHTLPAVVQSQLLDQLQQYKQFGLTTPPAAG